ncbi:cryptochrome/photolyase family protein [Kangiella marina]|uniref:Cryptochrome/photolyase family protein n=1 Tax=Kangiella marina TaxID=1079178 RepID=A0ABP8IA12_9GAMM
MNSSYHQIKLILGDQLNAQHSWFKETDKNCLYVIAELHQEMDYVKHHVQKVCAFFHAMQSFATALNKAGHDCLHLTLDDTQDFRSLPALVKSLVEKYDASKFSYQLPDEYRLRNQLSSLLLNNVEVEVFSTEHFYLEDAELGDYFTQDKHNRMESFYRKMRKRFSILMSDDKPQGGQWNYDQKNRNKLKSADLEDIPEPLLFANDMSSILKRLERHQVTTFGQAASSLLWPTSRQQSRELLNHFCQYCLPRFGEFQDAMTFKSDHKWSLYHSRLSFALNAKMLSPQEVISKAVDAYNQSQSVDIAQVEGFVRQILGWREFVRGIYWTHPNYGHNNFFKAQRDLPHYFWTGDTRMRCLSEAIKQSLDYAYAHHIQRLMITGNFCMLTEIDPDQVDDWYLGIYVDAIEWVEMPNTRGMSQFADGGIIATKPYAASANYVHKMSDYCSDCYYSHQDKTSQRACPLNSLYWRFIDVHRDKLGNNQRMGMIYNVWDKKSNDEKEQILNKAAGVLRNIDAL